MTLYSKRYKTLQQLNINPDDDLYSLTIALIFLWPS